MADINLSPYTADQQAMDRRRKMAEAMQQQAIAPIEMPTMPGVRVSPYAGLAKLLQSYVAKRNLDKSDQEQKDYENRVSEDQAKFARNMGQYETMPGEVISRGTETTYPMKENTTPWNQNVPAVDVSAGAMPVAGQPEQRAPVRQIPLLNASLLESTNPLAFKTGQGKQMLFQYLMQQEAQKQAAAQAQAAAQQQIHTLNPEQTAGRFVNGQFVPLVTGKPKEMTEAQRLDAEAKIYAARVEAEKAKDQGRPSLNFEPAPRGVPIGAKRTGGKTPEGKDVWTLNGEMFVGE
jgi:hypothetical protein